MASILNSIKQNGLKAEHETKYQCSKCKDVEWILDPETNTAIECECREKKIYQRILEASGISIAFLNRNFQNFKTDKAPKILGEAKSKAIKYSKDFEGNKDSKNNSIAFLGQVGCGKTHLTMAIANELMKKNIGVLYMQYREAIVQLKQNAMDEEEYQRQMNKYKAARVLLIDDLFKGKTTDSDNNIMFEIINYRYLKAAPMIISSELNTIQLLEKDEAVGSRIIEMCKGNIIEFEGVNLNHRLVV